ncbi:hypothetical protein C2S53_002928 [Perilla frutescens var. hirtella]|uniref:SNF2 N-terminal domain-containing protein n=1 Tax=Perilla frutescens var. hirtella TaxID=608512 RepID=A0AAD4JKW7_PERFH|nr:hypothetical protein C2S53_002928 [Perilla frutescens var. hirtella]
MIETHRSFLNIATSNSFSRWEADFERLVPSFNLVVYSGSSDTRKYIRASEFYDRGGCMMVQVLLSSVEVVLEDLEILKSIQWKAIVIDEYHHSGIANELEQIKMLSTEMRIILVSDHIKGHRHPQTVPLAQIVDALAQIVDALLPHDIFILGARDLHPQRVAHAVQQLQLQLLRHRRHRRRVEDLHAADEALHRICELILQHRLVGALHQRDVVEPNPVHRNPIAVDEESVEEQEIGQKRHHDRGSEHHVRHHAGERDLGRWNRKSDRVRDWERKGRLVLVAD